MRLFQPRQPIHATLLEAFVLLLLLVLTEVAFLNTYWAYDDAYFFVRYANNILSGFGYTWNPGSPPVDGITSPLWLALVTAVLALRHPGYAAYGDLMGQLSNVFSLVLLVVLFVCVRSVLPAGRKYLALLPSAYLTLMAFSVGTLVNTGMETALACVVVVLYATAVGRLAMRPADNPPPLRSAFGLGAMGLVLVLTRPELGLLALGMPALLVLMRARSDRPRAIFFLVSAVVATLLIAVYLLLRLKVFGEVAPLAFHVKGSYWRCPYRDFNKAIREALGLYPLWYWRDTVAIHAAVFFSLTYRRRWMRLLWLWLPLYTIVAYVSTTMQIMGHNHRYYFPATSGILVLLGLCWTSEGDDEPPAAGRDYRFLLHSSIAVVALVQIALFFVFPKGRAIASTPPTDPHHIQMAKILNPFPDGIRVAATEVGAIGALNPHLQIIDCAGLNDPVFARGFSAEKLFAHPPDVITLIHADYGGMTEDIHKAPEFADYELGRKLIWWAKQDALDSNVLIWRKSPHYAEMLRLLKEGEAADKEKEKQKKEELEKAKREKESAEKAKATSGS